MDPRATASKGRWIGAEIALFAGHGFGGAEAVARFHDFRLELAED